MELMVPRKSLIVLCGVAGCGKSTFAMENFKSTEIVSSDGCRAIVSDDEGAMDASKEAFDLFYYIIEKRMAMGRLVVADSTALSYDTRKRLVRLGKINNYHVVLLSFDVPVETALERNGMRERKVPEEVIRRQYKSFTKSLDSVKKEGFDRIVTLKDIDIGSLRLDIIESDGLEEGRENIRKRNIVLGDFIKPFTLEDVSGNRFKFTLEEAETSVNIIKSLDINPSWLVYIPPVVPSVFNGSIENQVEQSFNYYKNRGIRKIVIEEREPGNPCVIIICRDKKSSEKYFSENKAGQLYYLNNIFAENINKEEIVYSLHEDLMSSRYFEKFDTEYLIIQADIIENNNIFGFVPVRILAHSGTSYIHKDNIWQIERINSLCSCSNIFVNNQKYIIEESAISWPFLGELNKNRPQSFVVKPAKAYPKYKDNMMIPEIKCSIGETLAEEYYNLSNFAYGISRIGLEKYVKNKLPKDYFKYIIGSVVVNNKLQKIG